VTTSDADGPPVWLLDVDGVLNAVTASPDPTVWPEWRQGRATALSSSWPITWAPELVAWITRLGADGLADVRWLTTWEEAANASLAPLLGLPALPLAGRAGDLPGAGPHGYVSGRVGARDRWWKLDVARRLLDPLPYRPVIWTDDDLVWEPEAREWAERRPAPTLLIAPATDTGLTPEHLRVVEEFCTRWATGSGGSPPPPSTATGR
jgi:hypothetical protein